MDTLENTYSSLFILSFYVSFSHKTFIIFRDWQDFCHFSVSLRDITWMTLWLVTLMILTNHNITSVNKQKNLWKRNKKNHL